MKNLVLFVGCFLCAGMLWGQDLEALFKKKNYSKMLEFEAGADTLDGRELYLLGYAFYGYEEWEKSIDFYGKAIKNGYDSAHVYHAKGLALQEIKDFEAAGKDFDIAIEKSPNNQLFMTDQAIIFLHLKKLEKSIEVLLEARKLPYAEPRSYFLVATLRAEMGKTAEAIKDFEYALTILPKDEEYRFLCYLYLGTCEYNLNDYQSAIKHLKLYVDKFPENYNEYFRLIKAYNADKQYAKADKLFDKVLNAYNKGDIEKAGKHNPRLCIADYKLDKQIVVIYKYLDMPKEATDIYYKIVVFDETGEKIERIFTVELLSNLFAKGKGNNYVFCEGGEGWHATYTAGWSEKELNLESLQNIVNQALRNEIKPAVSSGFKN